MNEYYECERNFFDQQQQQLYNVALVLKGEQLQQPQQQINNLPGAALVDNVEDAVGNLKKDDGAILLEENNNVIINLDDDDK
jgi:hypothetical protein